MIRDRLQTELDKYYGYNGDNCVRYTHRLRIDRIGKIIQRCSNSHSESRKPKALDAGCNHGVYSLLLAEAGCDVLGIDINEQEVARACEWAGERGLQNSVVFQVGDIQHINSSDSAFDLIVCSEVLEHLDTPEKGVRELYRVLKPNGIAIISMPNMGCLFGFLQWTYRKSGIRSALGKPPLDTFQIQHSRYWFGNILKLLKENGFQIGEKYSTSHLPYVWEIDALLDRFMRISFASRLESAISTFPLLRYLGFNFIVIARKPAIRFSSN
jgi:2-polyprenyl-3-methyl-5-hydroxy-6-metoxy-1,4-benzoquinol methylase